MIGMRKIFLCVAATTSTVFGTTTVTIDFNIGDQGETIVSGDGTLDSGYDFDEVQPYESIFSATEGVTFTSSNLLTVYDTDGTGGADPDLEAGPTDFSGGNGSLSGGIGNALILQTNNQGSAANNIDIPNDDGEGGVLTINSDVALVAFDFTFVDLDDGVVAGTTITFTDTSTDEFVVISFADFEDISSSVFSVTNVDFGNDHINDVNSITLDNLQTINSDLTQFDQIVISAAGSGALGEIEITTVPDFVPAPEPNSVFLLGLSAVSLLVRRKR